MPKMTETPKMTECNPVFAQVCSIDTEGNARFWEFESEVPKTRNAQIRACAMNVAQNEYAQLDAPVGFTLAELYTDIVNEYTFLVR